MKQKKFLALLLSLAMVFSMVTPAFAAGEKDTAEAPAYTVPADVAGKLVILHTNDTHGADMVKEGKSLGTAGVMALKKDFEAAGADVLLLSAGDALQGDPLVNYSKGDAAVKFLMAAGYDAIAPGNHEFDWGAENFFQILKDNKPQFATLAANILDRSGKPVFAPNKIFEINGMKVGVFGLDTPETVTKANPEKVSGLQFLAGKDLYACAQKQVDELRAAGCDLVIALGHLGVDEETAATGNRSVDVCNHVNGIDLFVDGHSHTEMMDGKPVDAGSFPSYQNKSNTLIVSTGSKLKNIGVVIYDKQTKTLTPSLVSAAEYKKVDPEVDALVRGVSTQVDDALKTVIGTTEVVLNGERAPGNRTEETNLGDFAADAILWFAKKDMGDHVVAAITNGGGIRDTIPVGDISEKTMNTVFPFGNTVVTLDLTGQQLLEALEAATYCSPTAIGAFPQVSGLTFTVDTTKPYVEGEPYGTYFRAAKAGTRVTNVTVGGQPLDLNKTYTIATNDFTAVGGDTYYAFKDAKATMRDSGIGLDQVLADYTNEVLGGTITAARYGKPAGRITIIQLPVDVPANAWFANAVLYVMDNHIMNGVGGNRFNPGTTVTRAQVYQTLYNMEGRPAVSGQNSFTDVAGTWYADAAAWAASVGLTSGTGKGLFAGDSPATREQLAKILYTYADMKHKAIPAGGDLSHFADAGQVAGWAQDGMRFALATGLLKGKSSNGSALLSPKDTAMRSELATLLMRFADLPSAFGETTVSIPVPAQKGIPAHDMPAIVTLPKGEGPFPAVVMLHGTGSNKHEVENSFDMAADAMAQHGIATIRLDFMGSGDSKASYADYCYTSANLDAKAAADYMAGLKEVDSSKLAILGWSQGGTNALMAAAAYPDTFKAVITWAGAMRMTGASFFEDMDAAYAIAKKEGSVPLTFDWRDPLPLGVRWFDEVKRVDKAAEVAKITAPILAINGLKDTTVTPDNAEEIVKASKNPASRTFFIDNCDHIFGAFTGDRSTLYDAIYAGIGFLQETFNGSVTGTVTEVQKYGNLTMDLDPSALLGAGFAYGDLLAVKVGNQTLTIPFCTNYSDVNNGELIIRHHASKDQTVVAINMGNFAKTYGAAVGDTVTFSMQEKGGYLSQYQAHQVTRTNNRADYASDEIFANFRPIVMGKLPEGVLYRTSSPVNPELGRAAFADDLIEKAGVKTVINLADSKEDLNSYFAAEGFDSPYYKQLVTSGNVIPLSMGVDFADPAFQAKLKEGLEFMLTHEGPYAFHCTEGKDRAGFMATLLEALMGATQEEIVNDYMLSYENYYHVEKGSEQYKLIAQIASDNLCNIAGLAKGSSLQGVDLVKAAEGYLARIGLSAEQIQNLKTALSTPMVVGLAA